MAETDSADAVRGDLHPRGVLTFHLWLQRSRFGRENASVRVSGGSAGVDRDRGINTVVELEFESPDLVARFSASGRSDEKPNVTEWFQRTESYRISSKQKRPDGHAT
jgi:hypothetical protein